MKGNLKKIVEIKLAEIFDNRWILNFLQTFKRNFVYFKEKFKALFFLKSIR